MVTLNLTPAVGPTTEGDGGALVDVAEDGTFHRADHRVAERHRWPWLPVRARGTLALHPYCEDCGLVKFVGGDRARDIGGLANLLGRLTRTLEEHGYKVTEAQTRLILKRLHELEADDTFTLSREHQLHIVADVAGQYLGLRAETVDTYLRSC